MPKKKNKISRFLIGDPVSSTAAALGIERTEFVASFNNYSFANPNIPRVGKCFVSDGIRYKIEAIETNQMPDGRWPVGEWPRITVSGHRHFKQKKGTWK